MVSGSGICAKRVVVDARHHMLGRLSSIIAKELLNGQKVVVVRCEEICISGGLVRQKMKYMRFLRKRMNTKPSHGPIHFRAPAKILWRTIRGMIPHKTKRGAAALARFKAYEGIPPPYDKIKRMVIPDALKVLRLQAGHKYCLLGKLSSEVGWNHYDTIKELERKRKERAQVAYERKKQLTKLRVKAEKTAEEKLGPQLEVIAPINKFCPTPSYDPGIPNPFNSRLLPQILTKPILQQKRKVTKKEFALFAKRLKEICDAPEAVSSDPETVTIIPQVKLEHSIQEERHKSKGQGRITITVSEAQLTTFPSQIDDLHMDFSDFELHSCFGVSLLRRRGCRAFATEQANQCNCVLPKEANSMILC
nr:60s ribosomal protein l13a-4 [Quercus suber]